MPSLEIDKGEGEGGGEEGASYLSAVVNLAKLCIGTGILALPFATLKGGLLFAPLGIGIIAFWNWISCRSMISAKYASLHKPSPDGLSSTFSRIAYCSGGWAAVYLTDASIIITLLGVCITYQITFSKLMEDFLQSQGVNNVSSSHMSLFTMLILAPPVVLTTDVSRLTHFSVAGLFMLLVGVAAIVLFGVSFYGNEVLSGSDPDTLQVLPLWPQSLEDFSAFIGIATFGFGVCSLVFPVEESMKDKAQFNAAAFAALLLVWITYSVMGAGVSALFIHDPHGIAGNILENLPQKSLTAEIVRVSFSIVCLLTYPLAFIPPAAMTESYILRSLGQSGNGTDVDSPMSTQSRLTFVQQWFTDYEAISSHNPDSSRLAASSRSSTSLSGTRSGPESLVHPNEGSQSVRKASALLRYANRITMLALCTSVSTNYPCFGMLVSLLGCFTVTILSFVLPPFFRLMLVSMPASDTSGIYPVLIDILMTGLGALLCITSTLVITRQILFSDHEDVC